MQFPIHSTLLKDTLLVYRMSAYDLNEKKEKI
jgi:hypothetical protein